MVSVLADGHLGEARGSLQSKGGLPRGNRKILVDQHACKMYASIVAANTNQCCRIYPNSFEIFSSRPSTREGFKREARERSASSSKNQKIKPQQCHNNDIKSTSTCLGEHMTLKKLNLNRETLAGLGCAFGGTDEMELGAKKTPGCPLKPTEGPQVSCYASCTCPPPPQSVPYGCTNPCFAKPNPPRLY